MSYRRPYRRGGGGGNRSNRTNDNEDYSGEGLSIRDIQHHFWKSGSNEEMTGFGEHATLNNSVSNKDGLSYVLLFRGANPRWKTDNIIFVKSNLDILPDYYDQTEKWILQYPRDIIEQHVAPEPAPTSSRMMTRDVRLELEEEEEAKVAAPADVAETPKKLSKPSLTELAPIPPLDYTPTVATPIAVFEQVGGRQSGDSFKFAGWYTLQHVAIIAPFSEPLKRLLAQKWQFDVDANGHAIIKPRDEQRWRESFEKEWAVIKFCPLQDGDDAPPKLVVEKAPPKKSVNDLLAEMRLGKANSSDKAGNTAAGNENEASSEAKQKAFEEKAAQEASKVGKWAGFAESGHKEHDTDLREKTREMGRIAEQKSEEKRLEDAKVAEPLDYATAKTGESSKEAAASASEPVDDATAHAEDRPE